MQHLLSRTGGREQGRSETMPSAMAVNADHAVGLLWLPSCALPGDNCRLKGVPLLIQHTLDCSPHGRRDLGCVIIDDLILQHSHHPSLTSIPAMHCSNQTALRCATVNRPQEGPLLDKCQAPPSKHSKPFGGGSTCSRKSPASHCRQRWTILRTHQMALHLRLSHLDPSVPKKLLHAVPGGVCLPHQAQHPFQHVPDGVRRRLEGANL